MNGWEMGNQAACVFSAANFIVGRLSPMTESEPAAGNCLLRLSQLCFRIKTYTLCRRRRAAFFSSQEAKKVEKRHFS